MVFMRFTAGALKEPQRDDPQTGRVLLWCVSRFSSSFVRLFGSSSEVVMYRYLYLSRSTDTCVKNCSGKAEGLTLCSSQKANGSSAGDPFVGLWGLLVFSQIKKGWKKQSTAHKPQQAEDMYWLREQSCVWTKIYIHVAKLPSHNSVTWNVC